MGHCANECKKNVLRCFKCGKTGYHGVDYTSDGMIYYNYDEHAHISTNFQKPKKAQSGGKVFALIGTKTTSTDHLIRGTCFRNGIPLIAIIDIDIKLLFVLLDYTERLGVKLSSMNVNLIVDTLALGLVTTSWVCLNCPLMIYGKSFGMDLVCLPLRNLDVILGMNWLEFNHVHINYFNMNVSFP